MPHTGKEGQDMELALDAALLAVLWLIALLSHELNDRW
jgi:hypothetical protein